MATLNAIQIQGRLTRDAEIKDGEGWKVATISIATDTNLRKGADGQWTKDQCFTEVKVWNRGQNGRQADHASQLRKGQCVIVAGELRMDMWDDKATGTKRSKHYINADSVIPIELPRRDGGSPQPANEYAEQSATAAGGGQSAGYGGDIPF